MVLNKVVAVSSQCYTQSLSSLLEDNRDKEGVPWCLKMAEIDIPDPCFSLVPLPLLRAEHFTPGDLSGCLRSHNHWALREYQNTSSFPPIFIHPASEDSTGQAA